MRWIALLLVATLCGCSNAVTRFEVTSGVNLSPNGGFEGGREDFIHFVGCGVGFTVLGGR